MTVGLVARCTVRLVASHSVQPGLERVVIVVEMAQIFVENARAVGERLVAVPHRMGSGMAVEAMPLIVSESLLAVLSRNEWRPKWRQFFGGEVLEN